MKIILNNTDFSKVYKECLSVLNHLQYQIRFADEQNGIISAVRGIQQVSILDLKIFRSNTSIKLIVFPGRLTSDFECISNDEESGTLFTEKLMDFLRTDEKPNAFHLQQEDYCL